ncbi:MAG: hypothetical protein AAF614_01940 [Chloroflexota bacterium]
MFKSTKFVLFIVILSALFSSQSVLANNPFMELATIDTEVRDLVAEGSMLYVLTPSTLEIYDVRSPEEPAALGTLPLTSNAASYIAVVDDYIYLSQYQDGLLIIDVSDSTNPQEVGHIETEGQVLGRAAAQDELLYSGFRNPPETSAGCIGAIAEAGVRIFDISDPTNPEAIGEIIAPGSPPNNGYCDFYAQPIELMLADNMLVALVGGNVGSRTSTTQGLWLLDVSDPTAPAEQSYTESGRTAYWHVHLDNDRLYTTAPSTGPNFFAPPRLTFYDASQPTAPDNIQTVYGCPPDYLFASCTPFGPSVLFYDLALTELGLVVATSEGMWVYDETGNSLEPIIETAYQGKQLITLDDYLLLGDGSNGITIFGSDAPPAPENRLEVTIEQSAPGPIPSSGGYVEYMVTVHNSSEADTAPITLTEISTSAFGEIAPSPNGISTGDCWWWLPTLWPGNSWSCSFTLLTTANDGSNLFATNLEVEGTADNNQTLLAQSELEIPVEDGPGIGDVTYWAENVAQIEALAQSIDADGDGNPETVGFLIGDTNLNGTCDFYEVWWTQACITVSTEGAHLWLTTAHSADKRFAMTQEQMAAWLNVRARNDYLCATLDIALFLGNLWLHEQAPEGNPLLGGDPVKPGAAWDAQVWLYNWLRWYNETGGGCQSATSLAQSQDTFTRSQLMSMRRMMRIHSSPINLPELTVEMGK